MVFIPAAGRGPLRSTFCAILLTASLLVAGAHCQDSDGDESFEFQHQDIGRISGLSSGSPQVAPRTSIVSRPQTPIEQPQRAAPVPSAAVAPAFERAPAARQTQRHQSGSQRKPQRITLVPRRDPGVASAPASAQQQQPSILMAAQLPAPPQQPQLQTAPSALAESPQPTFAPQPPQQEQRLAGGPALSSFRATGGSVSARHSALIAQVAAERAAAATLILPQSEPAPSAPMAAPSFGPSEALAQQTTQHHHHHHHNAQPQQQPQPQPQPQQPQPQSAFASFAPQLAAASARQQPQQHLAAASQAQSSVRQPDEPPMAPSFEHVLGHGCPQKGVFSWENRDHCDRYYLCTNGTFTEEACPNGLAYSQQGAVYQHCAYNWNVDCGRKKTAEPIASPGCPWQFGIFPIAQNGRCSIDYYACEWGVPDTKRCSPEGLFYDDRIKGCQWADQLGCKSEALLNFKCPAEDEDNPYWPYPRYYHTNQDVIVCVNEQPRLVHCTEEQLVEPSSLSCVDVKKRKTNKPF